MIVKQLHKIKETMLRTLVVSKLRVRLLYSKPKLLCESVEGLCGQLKKLFDTRENKGMARRKFEARKWKMLESFTEHFNEKVILSNGIEMDEDELVKYASSCNGNLSAVSERRHTIALQTRLWLVGDKV